MPEKWRKRLTKGVFFAIFASVDRGVACISSAEAGTEMSGVKGQVTEIRFPVSGGGGLGRGRTCRVLSLSSGELSVLIP